MFCKGCPIQDGRLTAKYGLNIFWAITRYWIEILTSKSVRWYLKMNIWVDVLSGSSDSRWLNNFYIWSKPILGHNSVLNWDIDFKISALVPKNEQLILLFDKVIRFKMANWPPYMLKPTLGHNSVLDWDIDFKFSALVEILQFCDYQIFGKFCVFSKFRWILHLWKNLKVFTKYAAEAYRVTPNARVRILGFSFVLSGKGVKNLWTKSGTCLL